MILEPITKQEAIDKALTLFDEGFACSQAVLLAFAEQFKLDETSAKLISSTFGGGMGRLRQKCGAVTGGFMVLGLTYGNTDPKDMNTKLAAYGKVQKLNSQFEEIHGTSICSELLEKHATEDEIAKRMHHHTICHKVIVDTTALLFDMLEQPK